VAVHLLEQGIADVLFVNRYEEVHDRSTALASEEDLATYRATQCDFARSLCIQATG